MEIKSDTFTKKRDIYDSNSNKVWQIATLNLWMSPWTTSIPYIVFKYQEIHMPLKENQLERIFVPYENDDKDQKIYSLQKVE